MPSTAVDSATNLYSIDVPKAGIEGYFLPKFWAQRVNILSFADMPPKVFPLKGPKKLFLIF